jgi:hypothetical protein
LTSGVNLLKVAFPATQRFSCEDSHRNERQRAQD